jgi:hypothetical protein
MVKQRIQTQNTQTQMAKAKGKAKAVRMRSTKRSAKRRRRGGISGSGAYSYAAPGPWGKGGRAIGHAAGSGLGAAAALSLGLPAGAGSVLGSYLGEKAGGLAHYIGRLFGSGAYHCEQSGYVENSLFSGSTRAPQFGMPSGSIRVERREYKMDIVTATEDTMVLTLPLSAGSNDFLPWVSSMGQHYQKYRFRGLVVEYVSETSPVGIASTAMGYVAFGVQYDPALPAPTTKRQILNLAGSQSAVPSQSQLVGVECAAQTQPTNAMYVQHGTIPTGQAESLYSLGTLYCMVGGMPVADLKAGEIHVSVDVEFYQPSMPDTIASRPYSYGIWFLNGVTGGYPLGTSAPTLQATNDAEIAANGWLAPNTGVLSLPRPPPGHVRR